MAHSISVDTDRFYKNPYLEVVDALDLQATGPNSFHEEISNAKQIWLDKLTKVVLDGRADDGRDPSVYTGLSGICYTLHFVSSLKGGMMVKEGVPEILDQFAKDVTTGHFLKKKRITFLCGDAGSLCVAYCISKQEKDKAALLQRLLDLGRLALSPASSDGSPTYNEVLYGRAGYLYSLLFVNQHFHRHHGTHVEPPIPSATISTLVTCIIEDGIKHRKAQGPPLHFEWHDKIYLGAAHGYVGILYMLLKAEHYMKKDHLGLVRGCLDWLIMHQLFPSGNLRSSVGSSDDKLVHFCHGAPGFIFLALEAARVFGDGTYVTHALKAGEVIWTRGLLKRSYSLCHGASGNSYALMALYTHTKDLMWLKRSCCFAKWCCSWGKHAVRDPDRPNSLFEGLAGTVYMLHDFHNFLFEKDGGGSTPKFPAFELD